MSFIVFIVTLLLSLLGISFALLNAEWITVNYYVGTLKLPISLLVLCSILLGIVLSVSMLSCKILQLKIKNSRLQKKCLELESKITG